METKKQEDVERLRKLADSLDCMTDPDFQLLADVTSNTTEAWRKRGTGPSFIRIGNRVFYPVQAVAAFMSERTRERRSLGGALL